MKKILLSILIILISINLIACKNNEDGGGTGGNNEEVYGVNDTIEQSGIHYTLKSVEYSSGTQTDIPTEGKEFVIVTVVLENKSDTPAKYDVLDWKLIDSKNNESSSVYVSFDRDTALSTGDLYPHIKVEGTVVFEKDKNEKKLVLKYDSENVSNIEFSVE